MRPLSLIAQSVERRTVNPQVPGSSPGRGARILKPRLKRGFFISGAFETRITEATRIGACAPRDMGDTALPRAARGKTAPGTRAETTLNPFSLNPGRQ